MNGNIFNRNFTFFNIIPYSPGSEKELAADAVEYAEKTKNSIVLYCLSLHPQGLPAMKKVRQMVESYRALKKELAGTNVQLGVLMQSILGHWPRVDKDEESWTRSVNIDGEKVRYCTLDPNFRKYIFDTAAMLAAENPVFLLGDDDIRGFSPKVECFCELHTAEFNRRTGNNFTPEEYREAVKNSVPGDRIHTAFEQLAREIPEDTAALLRQGMNSVNPQLPAGSCMPGWEYRFNNRVSKIMAAEGQSPVMRICNANYLEGPAKHFPYIVSRTIALRNAHPDIPIVLDESDTFPHTLYSRSSKSMHAKLCSSIFTGLRGAKLWYVNMKKMNHPVHENYTKILGRYSSFYQTLADEVQQSCLTGINVPPSMNFENWHSGKQETFRDFITEPLFTATTLGILGIPFNCNFTLNQNEIQAITGQTMVQRLTDEEITKILSGKAFIDGPAAAELCRRGFSELLGLKAEMIDFRFNSEINTETGQTYVISKAPEVPEFTLMDESAEVLTRLCYTPFSGAEPEEISPATVIYRNRLGGMVCCTAFHQKISFAQNNGPRKEWYLDIFDRLNGGKLPAVCMALQDITALTRKYQDGSILLMACNINFDDLDELHVRCAKLPEKIERLSTEGIWENCRFRIEDNNVFIDRKMGCYNLEIFRLK